MPTRIAAREKPILFSGPMVRAIVEGRKTQTRRVADIGKKARGADRIVYTDKGVLTPNKRGDQLFVGWVAEVDKLGGKGGLHLPLSIKCPYGVPGDRLWVRETLGVVANWGTIHYVADDAVCYDPEHQKAGFPFTAEAEQIVERYGDSYVANDEKCVPSIFMPRWASRLTLEITGVRVERVQDISEADAHAEGIAEPQPGHGKWCDPAKGREGHWSYRKPFAELWDSINEERGFGWQVNPWVWVIEFRRVTPC